MGSLRALVPASSCVSGGALSTPQAAPSHAPVEMLGGRWRAVGGLGEGVYESAREGACVAVKRILAKRNWARFGPTREAALRGLAAVFFGLELVEQGGGDGVQVALFGDLFGAALDEGADEERGLLEAGFGFGVPAHGRSMNDAGVGARRVVAARCYSCLCMRSQGSSMPEGRRLVAAPARTKPSLV
jgi:hypothetical protein